MVPKFLWLFSSKDYLISLPTAKIIYTKQNSIFSINLKTLPEEIKDGEIIKSAPKSLGNADLFPVALKFSQNGRYFSILSEKEYVISTSGVYRNSCFGNGTDLAWNDSGDFAVKDGNFIRIFKNFQEFKSFKPGFAFDAIFCGPILYYSFNLDQLKQQTVFTSLILKLKDFSERLILHLLM